MEKSEPREGSVWLRGGLVWLRLGVAQRANILPQCSADREDKADGPDFSWLSFLGVLGFRTSCLLAFTRLGCSCILSRFLDQPAEGWLPDSLGMSSPPGGDYEYHMHFHLLYVCSCSGEIRLFSLVSVPTFPCAMKGT